MTHVAADDLSPDQPPDRGYDVDQKTGELVVLHRGDAHDRVAAKP